MISSTVPAVDRTAPVQYVQPSDRRRHITITGSSPGIMGVEFSVGNNDSPRTSISLSRAKYNGTIGIFSIWMYSQTSISVQFDNGKTRIVSPLLMRPL